MSNSDHVKVLSEGTSSWNLWRESNPNIKPDLSGLELNNIVLSTTNSAYAKMPGIQINLKDADLSRVKWLNCELKGANLQNTKLDNADLTGSNLRRSDLRGTRIYKCRLLSVNLTLARMYKTEIIESIIWETIFSRVDLSNVTGLDTCKYPGPSLVDNKTLTNSKKIPLSFLQGIGLNDWQIETSKLNDRNLTKTQITDICYEVIKLRSDPTLQFYSCFISYSHNDQIFAKKLHNALQKSGIRCWLDDHEILPGDDIYEEIDKGIRMWDKILLCCSKSSLSSWWVDNEIISAFDKEQKMMSERGVKVLSLIPLNLDNHLFSNECIRGYKRQITSRLAADFTDWKSNEKNFDKQLTKVIKALRADDNAKKAPPTSLL